MLRRFSIGSCRNMNLGHLSNIGIPFSSRTYKLVLPEESCAATPAAPSAAAKAIAVPEDPTTRIGSSKDAPAWGLYPGLRLGSAKEFGFLQEWAEGDLAKGGRCHDRVGRKGDVIRTRFPPEPNGYLHIGHAKAIITNFGLAKALGGRTHLRFDDTNPAAEETEYVEAIMEDVKWLGYDWGEHCYFASGYFDKLYEWAEFLIKNGDAFVDSETGEEIRTKRRAGEDSKNRNRTPDENMKLFREMKDGKHKAGTQLLRMKGNMQSSNFSMRDSPLYRIMHVKHHRTGDKWCIYPLYDFAHGQEDAIEGITHSICTQEFETHRELYNWFSSKLQIKERPLQLEMARLNVTTFLTSKRKLKKLVDTKVVDGWDDPRMSTLCGLRRRGVAAEALKKFIMQVGVTRAFGITDVALLEDCIRNDLEPVVHRRMVCLDPLKVVIENWPKGKEEQMEAANHPSDPSMGSRKVTMTGEVWIERDDFREDGTENYFRLKPGGEVKLRYSYVIKLKDIKKDAAGKVTELRCTYDPESGDRKVKGVIQWVSVKHAESHTVRLYSNLLKDDAPAEEEVAEKPEDGEEPDDAAKLAEFMKTINLDSMQELKEAKLEKSLADAKVGERFQFERNGYFVVDKYSTPKALVFNRTLGLAVSGLAKDENKDSANRSRKDEQANQAAEKDRLKKIDPKEMFLHETDKYLKFDAEGIPTHDAAGEPLPKSNMKKRKAEWDKQKKLFESK